MGEIDERLERGVAIYRRAGDDSALLGAALLAFHAALERGIDAALLGEIVTVAFSQRRKLLRHTLGRWLESHGASGDFDLQRRAEEVPVAEYLALVQAVITRR